MFLERLPQFISNHPVLVALFVLVLVVLFKHELASMARGFQLISPAAVVQMINRDNALLIDVSPRADFEAAHIAGAKHLELARLDPEQPDLARVRDLPVVVSCRNGSASRSVCQRLVKAGFSRVHCLERGIEGWLVAELPVVKGKA
ncbi:MAG: rhodanese-like domain-containing protein [Lysobacterales bacterium]